MADEKISDMSAASSLVGSELLEVVQGGVNKRTTTLAIANLGGAGSILFALGFLNGATGAIISSLGVTQIIKGTAGVYTVQLSATFTTTPIAAVSVSDGSPSWTYTITSTTVGAGTSGFIITTYKNGVATNPSALGFQVMGL